jgi:hypothetical protein
MIDFLKLSCLSSCSFGAIAVAASALFVPSAIAQAPPSTITGAVAFAQQVHFDYSRAANFNGYRTYQWLDHQRLPIGDQILDQEIKRAVNTQLASKGLRRVESNGDLFIGYEAAISQEKRFTSVGGWGGPVWIGGPWGKGQITSSTIEVGKLVVGLYDPAAKELVWGESPPKP